ncbi:hypothetical protein SAMN06295960_2975 [Paenibacillus aquistagni]|uniref:Uncharacterized protein n=1 Tax=Paenibacillus aquistagni TaxID=1852522 RepID=A0A1X7L5B8_9BACL|nr:hypothetical protein SAMN06295960_2975 [Paenibacillus aquistagni]
MIRNENVASLISDLYMKYIHDACYPIYPEMNTMEHSQVDYDFFSGSGMNKNVNGRLLPAAGVIQSSTRSSLSPVR